MPGLSDDAQDDLVNEGDPDAVESAINDQAEEEEEEDHG